MPEKLNEFIKENCLMWVLIDHLKHLSLKDYPYQSEIQDDSIFSEK